MNEENGDGFATISNRHVDQRPNADPHCALEVVQSAIVGQGVPNNERVANDERLRELAESSPSIVTPLNSAIGYEEAAKVAKQALKEKKTIRQTVIDRGLIGDKLSEEELDKRLDVLKMAKVRDSE